MESPVNPDAGAELMLANWMMEEMSMIGTNATRIIIGQCIRMLSKDFKLYEDSLKAAAEFILARAEIAKLSGEKVNRFWFEDQKYLPQSASQATVGMYRPSENLQPAGTPSELDSYEVWQSMSERYRTANPWRGVRG